LIGSSGEESVVATKSGFLTAKAVRNDIQFQEKNELVGYSICTSSLGRLSAAEAGAGRCGSRQPSKIET
jgi:hypothetical protein